MDWDWEARQQLRRYADELVPNNNTAAVDICLEFLIGDTKGLGHGRLLEDKSSFNQHILHGIQYGPVLSIATLVSPSGGATV